MKVISVFGASESGKGTVATMLCMLDDRLHHSKFARPMKAALEGEYCLPEQFLEHRLMKAMPSGYKQQSFLDVMVSLYHEREHLAELPRATQHLLHCCQEYGLVPVFDDCRNYREKHWLFEQDSIGIWVNSPMGVMKSTDQKQWGAYEQCRLCDKIENQGSLSDLMHKVERLYHQRIKRWLNS